MIDIHVLTHSGTKPEWLAQCLASLEGEPVTVHVVEGVEGSVGAGRAKGYALGTHEFVGYIDSDDYVLPGLYTVLLHYLQIHNAVVPMEHIEYPDGSRNKNLMLMHNGAVYRRADIMPLLDKMAAAPYWADSFTRIELKPTQLGHIGCVWRIHEGGAHNLALPDTRQQELEQWQQTALRY